MKIESGALPYVKMESFGKQMTFDDFCKFYSALDICCLFPDFLDGSSTCHWKKSFYEGRWVAGITAGGCMNNTAVQGKFPAEFFRTNKAVAHTKAYMDAREVMEFVALMPGEYLIVPATFNPNETASFLITIISKSETHVHESSSRNNYHHVEVEKYEEVDAEQLKMLLNENILKGDLKSGGFSVDACRSMVALMDVSFPKISLN
uniref:Peptidase C2 calpain domain-containing protein n=1 Tax=Knipowitschia caucasica TaxID=637954 RepID=A0AAV2JI49_KNICA